MYLLFFGGESVAETIIKISVYHVSGWISSPTGLLCFAYIHIAGSASGTTVALQRSPPTACTCGFTFPKLRRHASDKPPRRASVPLKHQECKNQRHSVAHFTARKPPRSEIGCLFARRRSKVLTLRVSPFHLRLARTSSLIYKP